MTHAFGKGALISLLRQFGKLHEDKKQISVGVVGYPNCGKSSVINTLLSQKSCKVAPVPGETKIWQYVSLFKRVSLIDCPGVVVDTAGDTETDSVLKGVVRAERLDNPEDFVDAILAKVKREHIAAQYQIPKDGDETWKTTTRIVGNDVQAVWTSLKGGDPCLRSAALMLIIDFQRGRLPHFVPPPELKETENMKAAPTAVIKGIGPVTQNLDSVGQETMQPIIEDDSEKERVDSVHEESEDEDDDDEAAIGGGDWDDED
jgi:nuclear GTP-binding protein